MEEISEEMLEQEHKENVKTLWSAYETEDFNLKKLLGDQVIAKQDTQQKAQRPSYYYYYTDKDIKTFIPEGISGRIPKLEKPERFKQKGFLVRPIVEDVVAWMDGWKNKNFIGRSKPEDYHIILDGPRGCGKSTLLNPIALWARMEGWLVIYIPDGLKWSGTDNLDQSRVDKTAFDQLALARAWCAQMLVTHGDKLKNLPLRTTFVMGGEEGTAEFRSSPNKTIHDLLSSPAKYEREAADAVWHFRRELCTVHEYPIAIIADGVNAFHTNSIYSDPLDPYIFSPNLPANRLVLTRNFSDFESHGLMNGLYIGTTTARYMLREWLYEVWVLRNG